MIPTVDTPDSDATDADATDGASGSGSGDAADGETTYDPSHDDDVAPTIDGSGWNVD
jgi:hypothetical protein